MSQLRITETDHLVAEFCHTASSPRRSLLIRILSTGERTASELASETGFSPANVSQHLKLLRQKRIVAVSRVGGRARYRLIQPKILEAMDLMREACFECLGGNPAGDSPPASGASGSSAALSRKRGEHE